MVKKAKPVQRCSTCGVERRKLERVKNGWACWRCLMKAVQLGKSKMRKANAVIVPITEAP